MNCGRLIEMPAPEVKQQEAPVFEKWKLILDRDKGEVTYSWTVLAEMFNDFSALQEENNRLKEMLLKASYLVGNPATGISSRLILPLKIGRKNMNN